MRADLYDPASGAGSVDHCAAFHYGMADWFFHIDVRAGLDGCDGGQGMPVVGRGDDGDVRFLAFQEFSKVLVLFWFVAGELLHLLGSGVEDILIDITHSDHFALAALSGYGGDVHAPPAATDEGGAGLFVGGGP